MKHISKKSALWLFFLAVAVLIWCVNAILITVDNDYSKLHKIRLHTLNVWTGDYYAKFMVGKDQDVLWFSSWLLIGDTLLDESWNPVDNEVVFLWWGKANIFWSKGIAWIGWWSGNQNLIATDNRIWVVWGWGQNEVRDGWVVLWWYNNHANQGWVVVWWHDNGKVYSTINSVILWWNKNTAQSSSLAFWSGSVAKNNSFSWNANNTKNRSARIDASNWVLIGTYTGIDGVNLVVDGAMKIDSKSSLWEDGIKGQVVVVNWCFYAYDGHNWHVINKWGWCASDSIPEWSCIFGNVILLHWEAMSGYFVPFDKDCSSKTWDAVCNNTVLEWATYPYCYKLS